jgi:hypothetical protein
LLSCDEGRFYFEIEPHIKFVISDYFVILRGTDTKETSCKKKEEFMAVLNKAQEKKS